MSKRAEIYNEENELINTFEGVNLFPLNKENSIFIDNGIHTAEIYYYLKEGHYIKNIKNKATNAGTKETY